MLRRGQTTTFQERLMITERAATGQADSEIAAVIGCSIWTVRKWRRIGQQRGRRGLTSPLGRPAKGPLSTIPPAMREAILHMRQTHPGWGAETLRAELQADPRWADWSLPSRSRIAAFLKHAQLTRRYQRHSDLPAPNPHPHAGPHDEWQLDAQGATKVHGIGTVSLITVIDSVSRLKVESYPCPGKTRPALPDYQLALRRAFLSYGLPKRIPLDRDTVVFDNTTPSPFPTRLHLWLLALGVEVGFIRTRRPTAHAKIERTHQTMTLQTLVGQQWPDHPALWAGLDMRRIMLNRHIPSRVLQGQAPLQAYPEAVHSGRSYRLEWEAELLNLHCVFQYLANCRWFRQVKANGRFAIGGYEYYVGTNLRGQTLELRFDAMHGVFVVQPEGSDMVMTIIPQGLTQADLMGALSASLFPAYQLALPFSQEAWRQLEYVHALTSTPA